MELKKHGSWKCQLLGENVFFLSKGLTKSTPNFKCKNIMNKIDHSVTITRMAQRHLF